MSWHPRIADDGGIDYRRWDYVRHQHFLRYQAYVEAHGLICQECGGRGDHPFSSYEMAPPEPCGFCETTGKVTRWMRGQWLRWKRDEKRKQAARKLATAA